MNTAPPIAGKLGVGAAPAATAVMLPRMLDLLQATPLRESLLGRRSILLDAGDVDRMSTPCAQVLLAAGRSAGASLRIINASAVFRSALAELGLLPEFANWMD